MLYWGKTFADGRWHNLQRHNIEVAAVLKTLLNSDENLKKKILFLSPLSSELTEQLLLFLACVHDLGKFSICFQQQCPDIARQNGLPEQRGVEHHTTLGLKFWSAYNLSSKAGCSEREVLEPLVNAALSHHGHPASVGRTKPAGIRQFFGATSGDALQFYDEAKDFFLKKPFPDDLQDESMRKLSWLAAGLFILSDWIGSNELWFKPDPSETSISDYWDEALNKAGKAILECRILPVPASSKVSFNDLFVHLPEDAMPSSLQQAVLDLPEQDGPELLIFEDLTGGGKTEAALLAAHRSLRSAQAQGVFIGLPTMATANSMYARLAATYRKLFQDEDSSLVLAHGSRILNDDYLGTIMPMDQLNHNNNDEGKAVCSAWFADNRKKSLLAPCGVGTIDQALLGVLSAKHQALRLLGISRSVLIVDEVHAYDTYTGGLLARLLTFHAALGGSAVLLSATLPQSLRSELADAWGRGRKLAEVESTSPTLPNKNFPLLTRITDSSSTEIVFKTSRRIKIPVKPVHDEVEMFQSLHEASQRGACACWIRNTVADAVAARASLVDDYGVPEDKITLFHARFTGLDRMKIEQKVLSSFGKQSKPQERAGKILIATQVVEQSLDLDFDLLLSDLAPMELMIQRAGRCHRHEREGRGQGFEFPLMKILMPAPVDDADADWYAKLFPSGQYVYPRPALLWRTARLLCNKNQFLLPEEARELVEGVYGNTGINAPAIFDEKESKATGNDFAKKSMANFSALDFSLGYNSNSGQWEDDTVSPTRLGEDSRQLRLIKLTKDKLQLWAADRLEDTSIKACMRSEVRVSVRKISKIKVTEFDARLDALKKTMPDKGKWSECIVLMESKDGVWIGGAYDSNGKEVDVCYSVEAGLEID